MERRLLYTDKPIRVFFLPMYTFQGTTGTNVGVFTPKLQAVEVEFVHAVSEGWGSDQSQHERHLVYQCYLQKHRSTLCDGSLGGRPLPKMML